MARFLLMYRSRVSITLIGPLAEELGFRLPVERRCLVREFSVLSMTRLHGGIKAREVVTSSLGTLLGYFISGIT